MILADTSVWIDHLRSPLAQLAEFVNAGQILMHSIIVGELACGNMSDRRRRLSDWQRLPMIPEASHLEVLSTIESRQLMGQGIGFMDAHLLCAVLNRENTLIWTRDRRLRLVAGALGVAFGDAG